MLISLLEVFQDRLYVELTDDETATGGEAWEKWRPLRGMLAYRSLLLAMWLTSSL